MDNVKIVKSPEEGCLLVKYVTKTNETETKQQRDGFISMLSGEVLQMLLYSEICLLVKALLQSLT